MDTKILHSYCLSPKAFQMQSMAASHKRSPGLRLHPFCKSSVICQKVENPLNQKEINSNLVKSGMLSRTELSGQNEQIKGFVSQKVRETREITSLVRTNTLKFLEGNTILLPMRPEFKNSEKGLGIVEFLRDKNFLITGATGFLAKVLIEKILRTQPHVGKLFLVIKAKDANSATQRIKTEIVKSDLFERLRSIHGDEYWDFMMRKLVPVVGDVSQETLGINADISTLLFEEVNIVINSAASTTFHERYDFALETNTRGASNILAFAGRCKRLQLLLHVSTAYVNGQRQGRLLERPFQMGHSIAREKANRGIHMFYPKLNVETEFDIAHRTVSGLLESPGTSIAEKELTQAMKNLGLERARRYGWQDTYVFSKAMGEMLIDHSRKDIPVVVLRPSIIESTYDDPFPGWIEGNRMMDPIVLSIGKGQLRGFLADENAVLDVVPVDMVVNAALAAMAKHADQAGLHVYHVASSNANPLSIGKLAAMVCDHFELNPYIDSKGNPIQVQRIKLFQKMDDFCSHVLAHTAEIPASAEGDSEKRKSIGLKVVEQAKNLASMYKPYCFYQGRFDNSNTEDLYEFMSDEEKRVFDFDVKRISWEHYIKEVHIPGLRRHVMKGRGSRTNS